MRKSIYLLASILLGASSAALGQTTLPLNTGFNHSNFTVYPLPTGSASVSDNYWIKVAASNTPPVAPAFVIKGHPAWKPPMANAFGSQWIGSTPTGASPPGPMPYAIFRKCFCLMPGYKDAKLDLDIRGDDAIQVWLNTVTSTIVPAQGGDFGGVKPIHGSAQPSQFRTGQNCLYVLVEDTGSVVTGFNLVGTVTALGLMPMAAAGTGTSFAPCQCEGGVKTAAADQATIQAIVKIAEGRRRSGATPTLR